MLPLLLPPQGLLEAEVEYITMIQGHLFSVILMFQLNKHSNKINTTLLTYRLIEVQYGTHITGLRLRQIEIIPLSHILHLNQQEVDTGCNIV